MTKAWVGQRSGLLLAPVLLTGAWMLVSALLLLTDTWMLVPALLLLTGTWTMMPALLPFSTRLPTRYRDS